MTLTGAKTAPRRSEHKERLAVLILWALGATFAVGVGGGLTGPFAVFCLAPTLAALAVGAPWREGAGLSLAVIAASALAGVFGLPAALPAEPLRTGLTLLALLAAAAAAAGGVVLQHRRAEGPRQSATAALEGLRALMRDLPELGLVLDAQGRIRTVVGQAYEILPPEALEGRLIDAVDPQDRDAVEEAVQKARDFGVGQAFFTPSASTKGQVELTVRRIDGKALAALIRPLHRTVPARPPPSAATEIKTLGEKLAASEAARKAAEADKVRAEAAAAARARFLANMSHELRTPLNAIMGFSDMMRARMFGELTPKYGEYADLIHESGGHLLALINDILDMSKIEAQRYALNREVFDVRDPLSAALRLMRLQADEAGVNLRAVLPREPLMVDADPRALKQIALNLLSNAFKFTPSGGFVILTAQGAGTDLELIVADTGMGISKEDLQRLGRPYEQAGGADDRARGSGLGLSLVDAFAKLHGGYLSLESRLGEGTAATVRLPVLVRPGALVPAERVQPTSTPAASAPPPAPAAPAAR